MTAVSKVIVFLVGVGFAVCGSAILMTGGITLPTKTPSLRFQFSGLHLFLLGVSPLSLGAMSVALAFGILSPRSGAALVMFGISMALVGLAFVLAPKG